jgi:hypothetical protein
MPGDFRLQFYVASICARIALTDNTSHTNQMSAGNGLDWFWTTFCSRRCQSNAGRFDQLICRPDYSCNDSIDVHVSLAWK